MEKTENLTNAYKTAALRRLVEISSECGSSAWKLFANFIERKGMVE